MKIFNIIYSIIIKRFLIYYINFFFYTVCNETQQIRQRRYEEIRRRKEIGGNISWKKCYKRNYYELCEENKRCKITLVYN